MPNLKVREKMSLSTKQPKAKKVGAVPSANLLVITGRPQTLILLQFLISKPQNL